MAKVSAAMSERSARPARIDIGAPDAGGCGNEAIHGVTSQQVGSSIRIPPGRRAVGPARCPLPLRRGAPNASLPLERHGDVFTDIDCPCPETVPETLPALFRQHARTRPNGGLPTFATLPCLVVDEGQV